jgi:hypothetical protein
VELSSSLDVYFVCSLVVSATVFDVCETEEEGTVSKNKPACSEALWEEVFSSLVYGVVVSENCVS